MRETQSTSTLEGCKKSNLKQAAFNGQGAQIALHVAAAHHVQNGIHTGLIGEFEDFFNKVLGLVIDGRMRAHFQAGCHLVGIAKVQNTLAPKACAS